MGGLFRKMYRFPVKCGFCGKPTDVMAFDEVDAGRRLTEKGWRTMKITQGKGKSKKESKVLACKKCARELITAQEEANKKMKVVKK
ncbi:MAG: hypothetical protein GYA45_11735 [Pelolinea sp.]|nr:hypothetical protein [Pelolinea sp.]